MQKNNFDLQAAKIRANRLFDSIETTRTTLRNQLTGCTDCAERADIEERIDFNDDREFELSVLWAKIHQVETDITGTTGKNRTFRGADING